MMSRRRESCFSFMAPRESLVFQYRLGIDRDLNRVADDEAAFVHRVVPTNTKVLPIDFGRGGKAGAGLWSLVNAVFPPGRLPLPEVTNVERGRPRHAANRQLASHAIIILAN